VSAEKTLIYITGCGHSGSTLLDMLLNGHSQVSALGEVHRLHLYAMDVIDDPTCTCGQPFDHCPFWRKVTHELQAMLGVEDPDILKRLSTTTVRLRETDEVSEMRERLRRPNVFRYDLDNLLLTLGWRRGWLVGARISKTIRNRVESIDNSLLVFEAVRRAWDTPIIVDSTKNIGRLKGFWMRSRVPLHIIYLLRDGRGVAYSRMQRERVPMSVAARIWRAEHQKTGLGLLTVPKRHVDYLRYEDLCRDPEAFLRQLCRRLSIDYEPSMLDFRSTQRHNLGGNPMRFRSNETKIKLDERWRHSLSPEDLETFNRIAGSCNQKWGYE
jgi:hypothetical protein